MDNTTDMVLCNCPQCILYTRTDEEGAMVKGMLVHNATRRKHWARASTETEDDTVARMYPHLFTQPSLPKVFEANDDSHSSGNNYHDGSQVSQRGVFRKFTN